MDLYHADIRLPDGYRLPNRVVSLFWTNHAIRARNNDRFGLIPATPILDLGQCRTIEVGMENDQIVKIVVRTVLDQENDLVFALIPSKGNWIVKTVWLNRRDDLHKTLDKSKYMA